MSYIKLLLRAVGVMAALLTVLSVDAQVNSQADSPRSPGASRPALPEFIGPLQNGNEFALPEIPPNLYERSGPGFTLTGIRFNGNTVFSDETLGEITAPFVGREIVRADLEELRLRLSRVYIQNGDIKSGARLPDQSSDDGVVTYNIIEGQLSNIRLTGNEGLSESYITKRLIAGAGTPLNRDGLQEQFQLLLTDPLIDRMVGSLRPGERPGESILDLEVTRAEPYRFYARADNHRPPGTGSEQVRLGGWFRNVTGLGDYLELSVLGRKKSAGYDASFQVPFNHLGSAVGFSVARGDSQFIEEPLDVLDIESDFRSAELFITHPLIN
ncbi:MAG: POTRA domain-containing protein, partial [Gammaproteobacteria bacterium]